MTSKSFVKFIWASRLLLLACAFSSNALWWPPSCPVLLPLSDFHTRYSESVSGSLANPTSPQHSLRLSSRALQRKWRERNHYKVLCNDFRSWTPNWPFSNSASSSASVSSLAAFGQFPFPCRTSSLAGMSSIALDSFSDSQNFFLAFKSLFFYSLVLSVFGFLLLQKSLNFDFVFACSFLCRTQIGNVCSFSSTASSWMSADCSI